MDYIYLWFNAILWAVVSFAIVNRYHFSNMGVLYMLFYSIINFLAIDLYSQPSQHQLYVGQNLFFLLYQTLFIMFFIKPMVRFSGKELQLIHPSLCRMYPIYFIVIILSLLGLRETIESFSEGIVMLATDERYGASLYHELRQSTSLSGGKRGPTNYFAVLSNISRGVAPFLFLYYISTAKKNLFFLLGLGLSTLITFMHSISIGSRVGIASMLLDIFFFYLYISRYYSAKIKKIISPVLLFFGSVIVFGFIMITISRATVNKEDSVGVFLERYTANSVLNFGKWGLDPGGCRYGDKTFPLIKSAFTKDVARSYFERTEKYKLNCDESHFISFPGDFIIDFGIIGGTIILLLYIFFFERKLSFIRTLTFSRLCLVYLLISILDGFYQYPLSDFGGNFKLLTLLFLFILFEYTNYGKISKHQEYSYPSSNV